MRNLLRSRRGTVALATVIALVPLIGAVALGGEAGSWYVTRQHAQNAADAAAYSGALRLACTLAADGACDINSVDYRGKEFAAQNAFCNAGDTTAYPGSNCATTLPTGISQAVAIDIGTYSAGTWTTTASGNAVRAKVSQQQPAYLSAVLGLTTVNIPAQAIAEVKKPKQLCGLGLGPATNALTLGGSVDLAGNGCGLQSDNNVKYSSTPTVNGSGWAVYGATGCTGSGSECSNPGLPYNYYMPPATDPLSILNSESFNSTTGNASTCKFNANTTSCTLSPNPIGPAYGSDPKVNNGDTLIFKPGTYIFYNTSITFNGGTVKCTTDGTVNGPPCTGGTGVNIVMLGNSSLSITGGSVDLPAAMNNTTYPDLNGVLFDDQAPPPPPASNNVTVNGGGTVELDGASYFPNVAVQWGGTTSANNNTCAEVIAGTLTMTGNAYMSTSNCAPGTIAYSQVVALVK